MRDDQQLMDTFLAETQKLSGQKYAERQPWISTVTKDAIRHFSSAICDDNPLWTDGSHATGHPAEPGRAPPGILIAARYPVLHGAPLDVPLISLLKSVEYSWERDIHEGEELQSSTEQGDVRDIVDPAGNRRIHIKAHTTYWNGRGQVLGRATGTVVRMLSQGRFEAVRWSIYRYSPDELERIIEDIHSEVRTGSRRLTENEFVVGTNLPGIVRGPLTIGDMVCWHSGIGPSYRPGPLGYKDTLEAPQFRVRNPITGWPIKYMLQHEDVNLAHQRGMPAPFDNGVMRFAWVTPLVTNWMGNAGFLSRLYVNITLPVFYGDTCWYSGEVTARSREVGQWRVRIRLSGVNQHGVITTTGSAEVLLPSSGQVEEG
jgi:acyl dehydratase